MNNYFIFTLTFISTNLIAMSNITLPNNASSDTISQASSSIENSKLVVQKALEQIINDSTISPRQAVILYYNGWLCEVPSCIMRFECTSQHCPFDRKTNPEYRKNFEISTYKMLSEIAQQNDNLIIWTAFATNGLKTEFNILEKFFSEHKDARVWFDCIDSDYAPLIHFLETSQQYDYLSSQNKTFFTVSEFFDKSYEMTGDANIKRGQLAASQFLCVIKTFIREIAQKYPKASLYIKPHSTFQNYEKQKQVSSHLVSSVDCNDVSDISKTKMLDYQSLVCSAQKSNPSVKNIALMLPCASNGNHVPSLISLK